MITFAIPYYQNTTLLKKACDSVLAQSLSDWKLIVCDDSPKGEARQVVAEYADQRIHYHPNPSRFGMVGNWNQCLELAKTEWVTILHADDEILPGYAALMLQAGRQYPGATILFCRAKVIDGNGNAKFSFPDYYKGFLMPSKTESIALSGENGLRSLLRGCFLFCPTVCFNKEKLGDRRFDPQWEMVQDLDFWARLLMDGDTLVGLPQVAYAYRRHETNSTVEHTRTSLRFREEAKLYSSLEAKASARGWRDAASVAKKSTIIKLNLTYCLAKELGMLQFKSARDKLSLLWQMK